MPVSTDLVKENHNLHVQNQLLRSENERLKSERVVKVIQQKKVLPVGYESNMERLKFLEKENTRIKKLLEYGNIPSLETLISEYKAMSKIRLQKIVHEYQYYYTNHEERMVVKDFIEYLDAIKVELQKFLFLYDNEKVGGSNA